ncbi:MAG: OmpA family protein [Bacteroidaceae bacterium]|nr:OmpA family protein [Bacteroidaceae bacterium]
MKKTVLFTLTLLLSCLTLSAQSLAQQQAAKDKEIAELKRKIAETEAKLRLERHGNLMPTVYFMQNSAFVSAGNEGAIEMIAKYIQQRPQAIVEIRGYASVDESDVKNLCKARVNAVANVLMEKYNIDPQQLRIIVYGATEKLYEIKQYNRLVTFHDKNMEEK